jgi:2-keto-3-deoxy-L-rhamnonate aldolase RhmA
VQTVIDQALAQIIAADHTAGTLVRDDNVERYLKAGGRFLWTGWSHWVTQGAQAFLRKVGTHA